MIQQCADSVFDGELAEVNRDERVASLAETLADLPGVVAVEIDGTTRGPVDPVVVGTPDAVGAVADASVADRLTTPSR